MKTIVSCAEMRAAERAAMDIGLCGRLLMENAATAAANRIMALAPDGVLVLLGKGNNAGDGAAVARRLYTAGIPVEMITVLDPSALSPDAAANLTIAEKMGIPVTRWCSFDKQAGSRLLVDALLGTGLRGTIEGELKDAILWMNACQNVKVALDIPSGIDGDSGAVHGCAVRADYTISFGFPKLGLYSPLSADYVGEINTDNISLLPPLDCKRFLLEKEDIILPRLSRAAHKGMAGRVAVLGGSVGMCGAVYMASTAAERCGAGLVTAVVPPPLVPALMTRFTGAMVSETLSKADVIVVGNGMGRDEKGAKTLQTALAADVKTLIIDADGLYHLTKEDIKKTCANVILTPHMGEMARLTGRDVLDITENRVVAAETLAAEWGVTVVLKGAYTVVAKKDGKTYINMTGNPGMAKGGSGDILAGMIGGLASSGVEDAATFGVFLHGLAGDLAANEVGERAMCAETLLNFIPTAIKCMEGEKDVNNKGVTKPRDGRKYI